MKHGLAQVKNHTVKNTFTLLLGLVSRHLLKVTFTVIKYIAESLMEWIADALKSVNCGLEVVRNSSHGPCFELDFSPLWPSSVTCKLVFFPLSAELDACRAILVSRTGSWGHGTNEVL